MKTIPLHGKVAAGRVALIDDDDYKLVAPYRWTVFQRMSPSGTVAGPYAQAYCGRWKDGRTRMHSLITGWDQVDHIDHDGLNNQRSNLRSATASQNGANRRKIRRPGSSQYKGVRWRPERNHWVAGIGIDRVRRYLGCFATEEEAARAYDAAALAAWGEYACLNFPVNLTQES